ncbi:MAG: diacylglycerol/lipid kinase family protein [Faecousia sp.]
MVYHVLFNPFAGNGHGEREARKLNDIMPEAELRYYDMTKISAYADFFAAIAKEDAVILAGGDGTINRFLNDTAGLEIPNDILYFAVGSGNDFLHDLGKKKGEPPFSIRKYLQDLPTVTVKGKSYRFLNGVGYGIDGYCCQVGDELRGNSDKPVNYTSIAIKGLLFHFKPANATITVDGKTHTFKKVWLAPTMHGRFYGGGMMIAPQQARNNAEHTVSVSLLFGSGKLKTLIVFPSIFKGEHVKHTEMCQILTGHEITVKFDRPTALQIDGETILDVTEYSVSSKVPMKV